MAIRKVGVLGCGLMGSGIAEVAAKAGFDTVVREVSEALLEKGMGKIRGSLGKAVEKGNLKPGDLVFFKNTYRDGISHVGVYAGGGKFVHAVRSGKPVSVSSLDDGYYVAHWAGAYRVTD